MALNQPGQCAELTSYQAEIMDRAKMLLNLKVFNKVESIVDVGTRLDTESGDDVIRKAAEDLKLEIAKRGSLKPAYDSTPHYEDWTSEELRELHYVLTGEVLAQ